MQHYLRAVLDNAGNIQTDATFTVFDANTTTEATAYAVDDTGSTALTFPVDVNADGYISFYAPDGVYDILVTDGDYSITLEDVSLADVTDAADNAAAAAASAAAAAASESGASTSAGAAATSASDASTHATNAGNSAAAASASESNAAINADNAGDSATAAAASETNAAADAALVQTSRTTIPAAITATGITGIVASFVYDTAQDWDGGAWRKKMGSRSWMLETQQSGSFQGYLASAPTMSSGDYYFNTTSQTLRNSSDTQIYRGFGKFPAKAGIVCKVNALYIIDMTRADLPVWMVFVGGGSYSITADAGSVSAKDGVIYVGSTTGGIIDIDYLRDRIARRVSTQYQIRGGIISNRNTVITATIQLNANGIVNNAVNDVAITTLSGAPTEPEYFDRPVPTVLVATDGGVSQISDDGNVWDLFSTGTYNDADSIDFTQDGDIVFVGQEGVIESRLLMHHAGLLTADKSATTYGGITGIIVGSRVGGTADCLPGMTLTAAADNAVITGTSTDDEFAIGHTEGFVPYALNQSTPLASLGAYITSTSNTGYMVGNVKTAIACDTGNANLISNGTFDSDTVWTKQTWVIELGRARHPAGAASTIYQTGLGLPAGKTYIVSFTVSGRTAGSVVPFIADTNLSNAIFGAATTANGTHSTFITTTGAKDALGIQGDTNFDGSIDNVFVREAVGDERILNGDFASDTIWTKGTGWTIGSGVATKAAGSATALQQTISLTAGKSYLCTFTVSSYSAGGVHLDLTGAGGTNRTANGTYTELLTPTGSDVALAADSAFVGSIDNVRVRETLVNDGTFNTDVAVLTVGTYWETLGDIAISGGNANNTGAGGGIRQTVPLVPDTVYRVTFTISNMTLGSVTPYFVGGTTVNGSAVVADGTHVQYLKANANSTVLQMNTSTDWNGNLDNFTITPVIKDFSGVGNHFNVIGELGQANSVGGEITGLTGFSATNYAQSEAGADGIGAGDFSFSCVVSNIAALGGANQSIYSRGNGTNTSTDITLYVNTSGLLVVDVGSATPDASTTVNITGSVRHIVLRRLAGTVELFVDGVSRFSAANADVLTDAAAVIYIGQYHISQTSPLTTGTIYNFRQSLTAPTDAQIAKMAREELAMIRCNGTLIGSSDAVVDLAYDSDTDRVHVATSGGVSEFVGLTRVASDATARTVVSAQDGYKLRDAQVTQPEVNLRD